MGLVFQFPERHFLGKNMLQELTFAWPQSPEAFPKRRQLALRMQDALEAVGMSDLPLDTPVKALSGGYKRRLALAIQLVRDPSVLCLDEPLAVRTTRDEELGTVGSGSGEESPPGVRLVQGVKAVSRLVFLVLFASSSSQNQTPFSVSRRALSSIHIARPYQRFDRTART